MTLENAEQKEFWEQFADLWVTHQTKLDALMAPVLSGVLGRAALEPGQRVLDVGCGTGLSTLQAAQIVGPKGFVEGIDISEPMLTRARSNAKGVKNARFVTADAAAHPFRFAEFDAVISRFGVMFFIDPVKAFSNMRRGMKPGAKITMASWSHLNVNPWFQVPMYAAKQRLGAPPPLDADAPGPLAFRDIDRVCNILSEAGFVTASGEAAELHLTPPGELIEIARQAASIGPAARTMEYFKGTEEDLEAIAQNVAKRFQDYDTLDGVRVPAVINFFSATAP